MAARRVLIVDADWKMRKLIRANLEAGGLEVAEAEGGRACLAALREQRCDLVVLSAELPDGNGWNVVGELRRTAAISALPIVIVVAEPVRSHLLGRFQRVSLLVKPFSVAALLECVERALHHGPQEGGTPVRKMAETDLLAAFAGESQAHVKYLNFAERARKEGFPNIARLFEAIAYAELVHASNHLRELGLLHGTGDNLQAAIDGENFEVDEMYPAYDAVARLHEEKGAQRSIHYAMEAEKTHAGLYAQAKLAAGGGQDIAAAAVHICEVCGHTVMGDAPDRCPVCSAAKARFRAF